MRYLRLVVVAVSLLFVLPYAVQAGPLIIATSVVAGCNGNVATITITLDPLTYSYYGSSGLYYHFDPPSPGALAPLGNPAVLTTTLTPGPHTVRITTSPAPTGGSQSSIYSFVVGNCGASACVPPPNTTMVGWYPFDELVGPTAANLTTGNTGMHIGGLSGPPTPIAAGRVAGALKFDGVDDYVESPSTIVTNFGPANSSAFCSSGSQGGYSACMGNFSIDAWVRIPTTATTGVMVIVDKRSDSPIKGYSFFVLQGKLGLQLADGSGTQFSNFLSNPTVPNLYNGKWHHLAVTVDRLLPTGILWYHNGAVIGPSGNPTGRQASLVNTSPLRIGTRTAASPLTGWFAGDIDELEIFNRALTPAEVSSIYAAGSSGKCK